ncbi:hypothetical protein F2P56_034179 [Juglans regia]|uniref:Disease resistance protein At4g27190-like leucine-rich repeats domain-containing protein n=1 Tax=Juglans regia TaxID=51240 RepID=A0A833TCL0_JUGRE|nr:hypothetical protein F2P56_034179 [Juglans regia]
MLNLENCRLGDVSAIGTLGHLEIPGIRNSQIEELPSEIGNLSRLKLLDMKGCNSLNRIAAGVLSGLSRLEELYMGGFKNWGCTTTMEGNFEITNKNPSLAELIPHADQLFEKEQNGILPCSLKDLTICRCEDLEYLLEATSDCTPPNTLHLLESLSLEDLPRLIGICKSTDSVEVEGGGITASTTVAHKLFSSNTILWVPNLESLKVRHSRSLEAVFDLEGLKVKENRKPILAVLSYLHLQNLSGMSHVWKNIPPGFQGFQNLRFINIVKCHSLRNLLPASIAKLLVQLQDVHIQDCNLMTNIIQKEHEVGEERIVDIIVFPKISHFTLHHLENLVSFSSEAHSFKWSSIGHIKLFRCSKLKTVEEISTIHSVVIYCIINREIQV